MVANPVNCLRENLDSNAFYTPDFEDFLSKTSVFSEQSQNDTEGTPSLETRDLTGACPRLTPPSLLSTNPSL